MSMLRRLSILAISFCLASVMGWAQRGQPTRVRVTHYQIEAEINPRTQTLAATVQAKIEATEDNQSQAVFELNNALNITRVTDEQGRQIGVSRSREDFQARLSFPYTMTKGYKATLTFVYDGRLSGQEDSPVYGIKFASIQPDFSYLMYPSRWLPVTDYSVGRFTSDMKVTVPQGYRVLGAGLEKATPDGDKVSYRFEYTRNPSFPANLAVVKGEPMPVQAGGVTTRFFVRSVDPEVARAYGEEIGKAVTYFTSIYNLPPTTNLNVIETDAGTPNGYSAPGMIFLSPRAMGKTVNPKLVANQVARQWWGVLISPTTRNHMWIENGLARYSEFLYLEQSQGPAAIEGDIRDTYVEALTVENPPLIQAARLEDFAPEYWAATAGKGAVVLHMLRFIVNDQNFQKILKTAAERYAWKNLNTDDFRKVAEEVSGADLRGFFIQWIESTGAPDFKVEYTVFRTTKGFRVMGKISQDLDTFRMPVDIKIETEGNPEEKRVEVVGTSSEFVIETFGKPKNVIVDPMGRVLRFSNQMRVAVAIRRGEQFAEIGEYQDALKEYQKALEVSRYSSLARYRVAELFFLQNNYQSAANEFRESINGDGEPKWTEVWAHLRLGQIFDITGQRDRAVNEYKLALRTKDNTQGALEEAQKYIQTPYERKRNNN
jgi:tetratricopeptide (TPR) repeat protein